MTDVEREDSHSSERWQWMGKKLPKSEIVYFCQMTVVFIIITTAIANLSLGTGSSELWLTLLSSAAAYVLPAPSMKS